MGERSDLPIFIAWIAFFQLHSFEHLRNLQVTVLALQFIYY